MKTILVIDDDDTMHVIVDKILGDEFSILQAKNGQEGIDALSENEIDLIITDIHMPGMSGLQFLESLVPDAEKKHIPILITTGQPTSEKEKKALDLGAADFIQKLDFIEDQEKIKDRVRSKIITNFDYPEITTTLNIKTNKLSNIIMSQSVNGGYLTTCRKFCVQLLNDFNINLISHWSVIEKNARLMMIIGDTQPQDYGPKNLVKEDGYQKLLTSKQPYLCNHVSAENCGTMAEFSKKHQLQAEIAIPLFAISEKKYLKNDREIPEGIDIFGLMILKRNKVFTTKEFTALKKLFGRAGPVFWRLFKNI